MFNVNPKHVRRVSFASRLFPKLTSLIGLDTTKLRSADRFDGLLFAGGRSKNKDLLRFFNIIAPAPCSSFIQLPLFRRSLKKLIDLVELELENVGAREISVPTLVPQYLWQQSKRCQRHEDALKYVYKFTDNSGNDLILGPTFEETVTKLVSDMDSIQDTQLPIRLYQTSPKFRYEPNPRFGVIRTNEFLMNDLYTFDATLDRAKDTYESISEVYGKIFDKLNLRCHKISGDTGSIGGDMSHEYQLPISSGEDTILQCRDCSQASNVELVKSDNEGEKMACPNCKSINVEEIQALELGHTFLLSKTYSEPFEATFFSNSLKCRSAYEMGCYGLGLTRILGAGIDLLSLVPDSSSSDSDNLIQLRWPSKVEPFDIGIVGPAKRSEIYQQGSSEFIESLVKRTLDISHEVDMLIEDRDKDGIGRRVVRLKTLGVPNIVVIGKGFSEDSIKIELLKLNADKKDYEQIWLSENQFYDYVNKIHTY